jgi:hypothetical protein
MVSAAIGAAAMVVPHTVTAIMVLKNLFMSDKWL